MNSIKRLLAVLIDMLFISVTIVPIVLVVDKYSERLFEILALIPFGLFLNKDALAGKSLGKRILGYEVRSKSSSVIASPFKCLIRNVTLFVYPIEAIILLINPSNRRIGDYIVNTQVEKSSSSGIGLLRKDLKKIRPNLQMLLCVVTTIAILFLVSMFLNANHGFTSIL